MSGNRPAPQEVCQQTGKAGGGFLLLCGCGLCHVGKTPGEVGEGELAVRGAPRESEPE